MVVSYLNTQGIKIDSNKIPPDKISLTMYSEHYDLTIICGEDDSEDE